MAIKALSESTIHLLGSSQVLTTPTSLIKELIDNALDAKATSIDILISQNTIDKIEVRDNGHGIQSDDLDALGRRGHTSKLTTFTELRNVGGRSLGFRGEALASACQLGDVSVTTKMDGEPVAMCVALKALGGIQSQSRISHPVGTTVCVMNFMSKLPVRKQTALKEAPKTISKIQELVQRYALARLSIKLTLKIIKGTKGAWSYTPRPHGCIKNSVFLVVGRDAALQCSEASIVFPELPGHDFGAREGAVVPADLNNLANGLVTSHFRLEAFLPRPDADQGKVGSGQYLSVDSRPVASEKGTMKKIVTIFKKYLRSGLAEPSSEKIKNPFMRLNIVCPEASYDPNVEPAKDDILFENETLVLEVAEKLFKNFYGECGAVMSRLEKNNIESNPNGFDVLLARKPQQNSSTPSSIFDAPEDTPLTATSKPNIVFNACPVTTTVALKLAESEDYEIPEESSAPGKRRWGSDMSHDYTEYTDDFRSPFSVDKTPKQPGLNSNWRSGSTNLNPWVIAKMTAPIQNGTATSSSNINTNSSSAILLNSVENSPFQDESPRPATTALTPLQNRHGDNINASMAEILQSHSDFRRHIHGDSMQPGKFSNPITEHDLPEIHHRHNHLNNNGFTTATNFVENSLMSPPNTSPNMQRQKQTRARGSNLPFVPPFRTPNCSGVSVGRAQTQLALSYQPFQVQREARHPPAAATNPAPEAQQLNPELEWAMDFEHRKESATQRRRDELQAMREAFQQPPATSQASSRPSPHKNRYNAALTSLETSQENTRISSESNNESVNTSLPGSDPRGYLIKRQKSFSVLSSITGGPRKLKRAQTLRLPLESIPGDLQTHRLVQTVQSDLDAISKLAMETSKEDTYVRRGTQASGLEMTATEKEATGKKLYLVSQVWMNSDRGEKCDIEFVFGGPSSLSGA
ncbi:hypothetical protein SBOR_9482 [Sclerotinia borealis F-4128]|uniref:DNA mismatch repair protein S5 domain-containing protein n=1 Tax=Sclerotinia borealis (strain F-4128) TaxID=1432307 RepID=W9C6B4_SCLBF|nr:hypothetical protein SBOR_9482 [Sclerotinia borealis F-4128]